MRQLFMLSIFLITLSGCYEQTTKTFTRQDEKVIMETIYDNGTKRVHTFTNPKVSTLIEQGLDERDAMSLIAQGGTFQENSFEPTLTGLIILLVVLLLLVILLFALGGPGDGFWVGFAIADILDFD